MSSPPLRPHPSSLRPTAAILAVVVLVALNLRLALSSLPAVATEIQTETGWSSAVIGALTTVPVLTMGLFALLVPRMAGYFGRRTTVAIALIMMMIGLGMRALGAIALTLFVSALFAGIAIAIIGGLLPGIVREQLAHSMGTATALWAASMMGGAALGAALTVPLAQLLGGWNWALAFWSIPAAIALIAWTGIEHGQPSQDRAEVPVRIKDLPWKDPTAWSLTAFLTLNSVVFISGLAWIAPSYQERGYSLETAGLYFGIFTAGQVVGALVLPRWSHRTRYRRSLFVATLLGCAGALVLIAFVPHVAPPIVLAVFSFNLSGGFAMGLGLLSEYASDAASSARLTAMGFAVTYSVAAFGPFAAGAIMDTVNSWSLVFSLLAIVTLMQLATIPLLKRNLFVH